MNEFDQFVKQRLRIPYYARYTDDFIMLANNSNYLKELIKPIRTFLHRKLALSLHPNKVNICKLRQGIDFLGYVVLPYYIVLRTKTKKRIFKKIKFSKEKLYQGLITEESFSQSLQSYLGVLNHCQGHKIKKKLNQVIN